MTTQKDLVFGGWKYVKNIGEIEIWENRKGDELFYNLMEKKIVKIVRKESK